MWKGLAAGFAIAVSVGGAIGCASAVFCGIGYGLRFGLVFGPIVGLISGVASILTGVLKSGWSSRVLDEHEFFRPNGGIRRSFKNALFAACLFGPIGGLTSGIVCGVAFKVLAGVPGWPILGAGFGILSSLLFAFEFLMIHGGIAVLEHYMLRWYLWKAGAMPWNYVAFLNFAVERILLRKLGGGYMSPHLLLLDYFATLVEPGLKREGTILTEKEDAGYAIPKR